jgi:hypothetical protein
VVVMSRVLMAMQVTLHVHVPVTLWMPRLMLMLILPLRLTVSLAGLRGPAPAIDGFNNCCKIKRQLSSMDLKPGGSLLKVTVLMVILQVLKVGDNSVGTLLHHFTDYCYLIIRLSLALFDCDGTLGAVADACAKAVAHQLGYQSYLTVNHLECPLMAVGYTYPATIALFLIYFYYISLHDRNNCFTAQKY